MNNAYYQVSIHASDLHKTAFISPKGLYEWNILLFGLCNAFETFQRLIYAMFSGPLDKILVYLDYILVLAQIFKSICNICNGSLAYHKSINYYPNLPSVSLFGIK